MRRRENLGAERRSCIYGAELYRDAIDSNNLGAHDRTRSAPYVALDVRALRRFSFSLGLRDEIYGSFNHELSPTFAAGLLARARSETASKCQPRFPPPDVHRSLLSRSRRMSARPTLRPERAWSYEGGLDWNAGGRLRASVTVFQRRERDGIDYVRSSPERHLARDQLPAACVHRRRGGGRFSTRVRSQEIELAVHRPARRAGRDWSTGNRSTCSITPSIPASSPGRARSPAGLLARTRIGALQRYQRDPYGLWDLYAAWNRQPDPPFSATQQRDQHVLRGDPRASRCPAGRSSADSSS